MLFASQGMMALYAKSIYRHKDSLNGHLECRREDPKLSLIITLLSKI
jgi:hypothetical protein